MKNLHHRTRTDFQWKENVKFLSRNECCLILQSSKTSLLKLEQFLNSLKEYLRIRENKFANILISVSEAVTNSISHGNKFSSEKLVYIFAHYNEESITFSLEDEGDGFDYGKIEIGSHASKSNIRGIYLIKQLPDSFCYSKGGRHLTMFFYLK